MSPTPVVREGTSPARRLPSGTTTLLFTDIEGSTRLVQDLGDRYPPLLDEHRRLLRAAWEAHGGVEMGTEGDSFFVAFERAGDAVAAARDAQRSVAAHGGQILLSDATRLFVDDIDVLDHGEHRLKDIRRPVRIFQLLDADLPSSFPPLRSLTAAPNNLPAPVDDFVGRAVEIDELSATLESGRLITLTGPGGAGKTRLALEVAARIAPTIIGGAWLVELAVTTEADRVDALVAAAVGVGEQPARPIRESLIDGLRDRSLIIVLDNCEHLIDAAASLVSAVLAGAPNVRVLATSRERLGVRGERVVAVHPMDVPSNGERAASSDAVALFISRARDVLPRFEPDHDTVLAIAAICRRLDGLPLAIELAAARVRAMPVGQLLERIDDRFRVLAVGERNAPSRQRTLEAVVAWSYDQLPVDEQELFRGLSVFPDSFSLEAVEAVSHTALGSGDVLDPLTALVDKSLVSVVLTDEGVTRYQLLETLRAFGSARLEEISDRDRWRGALTAWVLAQVASLEAVMRTPGQDEGLRRVRLELAHAAAALVWMLEQGDDLAALRAVSAIPVGLPSERIELIEALLARTPDISHEIAGQALLTCANLEAERGASGRAMVAARRAEAEFEAADDLLHAAWARFFQIHPTWIDDDLTKVDELCERVVAEFQATGSRLGIAYSSWIASLRTTDVERATELAMAAVDESRSIGADVGLAHALEGRALICVRADRGEEAIPFVRESLELFVRSGNEGCIAHSLEAAAACLVLVGDLRDVAELSGAAAAFREASGHAHRPWELRGAEDVLAALRDGGSEIEAARARGRTHSLTSAAEQAAALLAATTA